MTEAIGYAVKVVDRILPRTVCETKRGAIVNFLLTYATVALTNRTTDQQIAAIFQVAEVHHNAKLVRVSIIEQSEETYEPEGPEIPTRTII